MASLVTPLLPLLLPTIIPFLPIPPRYRNDRLTLIAILSLYIVFTFVRSDLQVSRSHNFYSSLKLSRTVEDGAVRDGWKAFARRNHPDRVGIGRGGEEVFVEARRAYDVLSDDVRRWAYDRFGPDIASWKGVVTQRDFLLRGVTSSIGYYVVSAGVHILMKITGQGSSSTTSFYRNLLLPTLLLLELTLLFTPTPYPSSSSSHAYSTSFSYTHPFPVRILTYLFPQRTQYQHIRFLHNLYVAGAMFLNQLGPLLWPTKRRKVMEVEKEKELEEVVGRLGGMLKVAEMEAAKIYASELAPLFGIPSSQELLATEMEQVLIDARIRSHPAVAPVWGKAVMDGRERDAALAAEGSDWDDDSTRESVRCCA